jgi:hypothetical protein
MVWGPNPRQPWIRSTSGWQPTHEQKSHLGRAWMGANPLNPPQTAWVSLISTRGRERVTLPLLLGKIQGIREPGVGGDRVEGRGSPNPHMSSLPREY